MKINILPLKILQIFILLFLISNSAFCFKVILYRDGGEIIKKQKISQYSRFKEVFLPGTAIPSTFSIITGPPIKGIEIKKVHGYLSEDTNILIQKINILQNQRRELKTKLDINLSLLKFWKKQIGHKFQSPKEIKSISYLLKKNLTHLYSLNSNIETKIENVDKKLKKLENQLDIYSGGKNFYYKVTIYFYSPLSVPAKISYRYFSSNIKWDSLYELKFYPSEKKANLIWMGKIYQKTGERWKGVNIILSTLPHYERMYPPPLREWIVKKREPLIFEKAVKARMRGATKSPSGDNMALTEVSIHRKWLQEEVSIGKISLGSGESRNIVIRRLYPQVTYGYLYRPLSSPGVFFKAHLVMNKGIIIPSGRYNIFVEGSFRGRRFIPYINKEATIFLGLDKEIYAKTISVADITGTQGWVSKRATKKFLWRTTLKNHKSITIKIHIEIPWPQSTNEKIKIKNLYPSFTCKGKRLIKDITLLPGEEKNIEFGFLISYPKNMKIEIIRKALTQ